MTWVLNFLKQIETKSYLQWVILGLVLFISWIVYSTSAHYGFITNWDDNINITQNKYITNLSANSIDTLFDMNQPIPEPRFVWFTYMIDYHFFKLEPYGYHVHSLLWHLLNVILVFLLARLLFKNKITALFMSMIFALHPMNIEAIVWITGRKDLIFTSFYLLAILIYIKYSFKSRHPFWFILVLFLAYMSSLSKIQSITFPLILILIDWFLQRKINPIVIIEKALIIWLLWLNPSHLNIITTLLLYPISFYFIQYLKSQKIKPIIVLILLFVFVFAGFKIKGFKLITSVLAFLFLGQFLLIKYSDFFGKHKFNHSYKRMAFIVIIATAVLLTILFVNNTVLGYLIERGLNFDKFTIIDRLFLASYSVSHYIIKFFVPFGHSVIQPYPLKINGLLPILYYLSPAFLLLLFGLGYYFVKKMKASSRELIFFALFFLITISPVLHLIPIYGHLITADRYSYMSYFGLSGLLFVAFKQVSKSFKYQIHIFVIILISFVSINMFRIPIWKNEKVLFDQVIKKHPNFALAYNNRGFWYYNKGNLIEAEKDFKKSTDLNPDNKIALYNLSLIYVQQNDIHKAISTLNRIDSLDSYIDGLYMRAYCYKRLNRFNDALSDFDKLIKMAPNHIFGLYNRGVTLYLIEKYDLAIKDYSTVIELQPKFHQAYDAIGNAYLMKGNYDIALINFDKAIQLETRISDYYINKAECLIKMGRIDEICSPLQEASKMNHPKAADLLRNYCK